MCSTEVDMYCAFGKDSISFIYFVVFMFRCKVVTTQGYSLDLIR